MKKVDFIFRVMIVMALLVPWTAWGQYTQKVGDVTVFMNNEGNLSKTEAGNFTSSINISMEDVIPIDGYDLKDWSFSETETISGPKSIIIKPNSEGSQLELINNVEENIPTEDIEYKVQVGKGGITRGEYILITVQKKKINASDVVVYVDDKEYTAGGVLVDYDGKPHGVTKVMIGEEVITDYTVSYSSDVTEISTEAPVHVACTSASNPPYKYTATITLPGYDVTGTITADIMISRYTLNISAKEEATAMLWENGEMVLTANKYVEIKNPLTDEKGILSIDGNLAATAFGDKYILKQGDATLQFADGAQAGDYAVNWGELAADKGGITVDKGDKPTTTEGEDIVIKADGEEAIRLTSEKSKEIPYNGKEYKVTKLGKTDLGEIEGETITVKYKDGEPSSEYEIKNAGNYEITVTYKDKEGKTHTGTQKLTITPVDLTVTIKPQTITVTDMTNVEGAFNALRLAVTDEGEEATVTIEGEQGSDNVAFEGGTTSLSLITPTSGAWAVGENVAAIQAKDLKLDEPYYINYNLKIENGALTVIYEITDENLDDIEITFDGEGFNAEGTSKVYDGIPVTADDVKVTVNGVELTADEYEVSFGTAYPVDAGTYQATVTLKGNYSGDKNVNCEITKRDLILSFTFPNPVDEGEVPTLDEAYMSVGENGLAEGESLKDCIDITFRLGNEDEQGMYDVYIESISIKASTDENNNFKPSNYNIKVNCGGVEVPLTDSNKDGDIDGEDEGNTGISDDPVGEIETVDPNTGEGSTGASYQKYQLYLANKDYLKTDPETVEHYESEGLELFSRHDKKTTWAGGSFTIWYEHNGEVNEGGYRIFWSKNGERGDYQEVKLDEVSGYYQIRNVQSNVYVKIYYETGFPVANEEISATEARAYSQAGKIVVITPEPTDVQIISMAGTVVANASVAGQQEFANLTEGVYIVRMGETVVKLQVRN